MNKGDIIRIVQEQNVKFVRLQFTDILGVLKSISIPVEQLEKALDGELMFDGSSIEGFVRIEESDMYLRPDIESFLVLPWMSPTSTGRTARLICDIFDPDGQPFVGCPRYALAVVLKEAKDMGYTMQVGPEPEFFMFQLNQDGTPVSYTHLTLPTNREV